MTATLEQTDVSQTAFLVIDVEGYLDVRQPVLRKVGAVSARDS